MKYRLVDSEKCWGGKKYRPIVWILAFMGMLLILKLSYFLIVYFFVMTENTVTYNITFYINGDSIYSDGKIQVRLDDDSDEKLTAELAATEQGVYTISKEAALGMTTFHLQSNIKEFENVMKDFHVKLMHYNSNEIDDIVIDWKINGTQTDGKWIVEHTVNCREGNRNNEYKEQKILDSDEEQEIYLGP